MRIVVVGATGGTGCAVVRKALAAGHEVVACVRDEARLPVRGEGLSILAGDILDPDFLARAFTGADAVACALGSRSLGPTMIRREGTAAIVRAMKTAGVARLVVVSAMGVGESWRSLSIVNRLFFALFLRSARADHEAQERAVKSSGLEWTIVRPSGLVDTPGTGIFLAGESVQAVASKIAREDVAAFIVAAIERRTWLRAAVTITT